MNKPEQFEQSAMSHMAKARELHGGGDSAAADEEARLAIKQMRASARARLHATPFGGINIMDETATTETYGAYLARLRIAAGFPERMDLARRVGGQDKKAVERIGQMLRKYEQLGALPRLAAYKEFATALGVSVKDLDPARFGKPVRAAWGAKKRRKGLPASAVAAPAKKAPAAPAGAFLRGITIEPAGDGLTLIRFEAVVPVKGSQDLVARLLQAAALAST